MHSQDDCNDFLMICLSPLLDYLLKPTYDYVTTLYLYF